MALSNLTIVGGALANFAFNINRRHPGGDKPLIDWDLIMVMEPTTILGALLGSYINKVLNALMHEPASRCRDSCRSTPVCCPLDGTQPWHA